MSSRPATTSDIQRIHDRAIIIDAHNDHIARKHIDGRPLRLMSRDRRYDTDARRLLDVGVDATLFAVGGNDLSTSLSLIELTHQEIARCSTDLLLVQASRDIHRAHREHKLGLMMIWEGAMALQNNLDIVGLIHRMGVRSITLCHFDGGQPFSLQGTAGYFGYCSAQDRETFRRTCKGLTPFGRDVVRVMNQLGMLVDLSHVNDAALYEAIEISDQPVAVTHGGAFACSGHSRCQTDEQLKAIAHTDGVVGVTFYDKFIARQGASVERIVDHIAYIADLVGISHVGIGSDFDGLPVGVKPVVAAADKLPQLTRAMLRRGFSGPDIAKVLGGNFYRLLQATIG